jgi:hypothetical protein
MMHMAPSPGMKQMDKKPGMKEQPGLKKPGSQMKPMKP